MAEPGDPSQPDETPGQDHDDDLIGFATPASLRGRPREEPQPEPQPEPEPEPEPEPKEAETAPVKSSGIFDPSPGFSTRRRPREEIAPLEGGGLGLYAVYSLILFAVPTFGVAAVIALFAVTGRAGPSEALSRSHFIYQQRTLWVAAIAALLGVILIVVNVGVFVLFVLALWLVARGAYGVMRLKAGRSIPNPRGWLF